MYTVVVATIKIDKKNIAGYSLKCGNNSSAEEELEWHINV